MCAKQLTPAVAAERSIIKKYQKPIWHRFIAACKDFALVQRGDKIAVCISGGKDSFLLAKCMQQLQRHSDVPFALEFICMDPGYNAQNRERIEQNAALLQIPVRFFTTDIFNTVAAQTSGSPCYLCARMRRGYLYKYAQSLGCNKIALGHHFNDIIETTLMSMVYGAECKTMLPCLPSSHYSGMQLIRPLAYVREADIMAWQRYNGLQFIRCACRFTENDPPEETAGQGARGQIKQWIAQMQKVNPQTEINLFRSMQNVNLNMVYSYTHDGESYSFLDNMPAQAASCAPSAEPAETDGAAERAETPLPEAP